MGINLEYIKVLVSNNKEVDVEFKEITGQLNIDNIVLSEK